MKIILFTFLCLTSLIARENPFEPVFDSPTTTQNAIPLLNIKTSKAYLRDNNISSVENNQTTVVVQEKNISVLPVKKPIMIATKETQPKKVTKKPIKVKKKKKKKLKKKKIHFKTIYANYFLKVKSDGKHLKIYSHDRLFRKTRFKHPARISFDFERLQYFHTKNITLHKAFAKEIKFGSHHHFYRITIVLNRYKHYKIRKKSYGYLFSFY